MGVKRLGIITIILTLIEDMILAAIPAVGFAMVFNVPIRALKILCTLWSNRPWLSYCISNEWYEY
ncbi:hypothetical protein PROPEN_03686 [Proteus penneri ATCC 35198]|nr:hypothetical protein PROPEN_03686 [Proteus penneri ATCC 35198]